MQDLISLGEAWFEQQRKAHLSTTVTYAPGGGIPVSCTATVAIGRWEAVDAAGQLVRMETRDFFIGTDDLPADPLKGDTITEGGKNYEVVTVDGSRNPWRWANRSQTLRRIHTQGRSAGAVADAIIDGGSSCSSGSAIGGGGAA
jgi:hypothetical protein